MTERKTHMITRSTKIISVFLSVLITFMSLPLTAYANEISKIELVSNKEQNDAQENIFELTDMRTASAKYFRLDDGSFYLAQYDTDIHYIDENGDWQDIDNTLIPSGSEFSTKNAKIKFAKKITGK